MSGELPDGVLCLDTHEEAGGEAVLHREQAGLEGVVRGEELGQEGVNRATTEWGGATFSQSASALHTQSPSPFCS